MGPRRGCLSTNIMAFPLGSGRLSQPGFNQHLQQDLQALTKRPESTSWVTETQSHTAFLPLTPHWLVVRLQAVRGPLVMSVHRRKQEKPFTKRHWMILTPLLPHLCNVVHRLQAHESTRRTTITANDSEPSEARRHPILIHRESTQAFDEQPARLDTQGQEDQEVDGEPETFCRRCPLVQRWEREGLLRQKLGVLPATVPSDCKPMD